jgi:hypothetical protein
MKDGWVVELLKSDPAKLDSEIQDAGGILPFFMAATPKDVHGDKELKAKVKKFQKQATEFAEFVNGLLGVKEEPKDDV